MSNNDLTPDQQHEVWLLACQLGIDTVRARAEWERRRALNKPQPKPQPEPIQEVEEVQESEESELEALKLENEKRKSLLISAIWEKIGESEEAEEEPALIKFLKESPQSEKIVRGFVSCLVTLVKFDKPQKFVITIEKSRGKIAFSWKMFDKDGKDVMFDKNGEVVEVHQTE